MNLIQITEHIEKVNNLIFYNKNVFECFNSLKNDYMCIYFNEPIPMKPRLIESILQISTDDKLSLNRLTIAELMEILINELKYEQLIILFNHFERLTKKTVQSYQYLNSLDNIQFVCSFDKKFKPEVYPFFKTFELVNREEYLDLSGADEINITYPVFALLSILCFFVYLKMASLEVGFLLVGASWFALIIFRSLMYVGGRI